MTRMRVKYLIGSCIALTLALPGAAQLSREGGRTQINADRADVSEKENQTVFVGNVDVIQGDARLRADQLTIYFRENQSNGSGVSGGFGGDPERMVAEGDVFYVTSDLQARGDRAVYLDATRVVTMEGNVLLSRGEDNVARGECLTLNVDTGQSTLGCGEEGTRIVVTFNSDNVSPGENEPDATEPDENE